MQILYFENNVIIGRQNDFILEQYHCRDIIYVCNMYERNANHNRATLHYLFISLSIF